MMKPFERFPNAVSGLCLALFFLGVALSASCSRDVLARFVIKEARPEFSFNPDSLPPPPDYHTPEAWAAFDSELDYEVDVFFIHPTTFYRSVNWNQPLDYERINEWTYNGPIRQQASAFRGDANLFAPHYRQANLYAFVDRKGDGAQALEVAYQDVRTAFLFYLEKINQGRPFLIAAHSQGSYHANRLIKELNTFREVADRFIAGYLIGWPVTEDDLGEYPAGIGVCRDSTATGCIVTWNTQRKKALYSLVRDKHTVAVNPLSWTTDEEHYDKSRNIAAVFFRGGTVKRFPHLTGARLHNGKLIVDKDFTDDKKVKQAGRVNYHRYDYTFFYENIRKNAADRIDAFLRIQDNRRVGSRE